MLIYNRVFRILDSNIIRSQLYLSRCSSNATGIVDNKTSVQSIASTAWQSAKPFEDIPSINSLKLIARLSPAGIYNKLDVTQFLLALKDDLGDIYKLPGLFGQTDLVVTHNVLDFERLYRGEGIWPKRPGLDALNYHRSVHRADYFQGIEGLLATHDQKWGTFRSIVNPILMQPKTIRHYTGKMSHVNKEFLARNGEGWGKLRSLINPILMQPQNVKFYLMSQVNKELIERIREIRDPNSLEVPKNFEEEINRWALESVSVVALDKHLGLINENRKDPQAKLIFKTLTDFISLSLEVEIKPSLWRYIRTPTFNKLMSSLDTLLEVITSYINEAIERLEQESRNGVAEKPEHEKSVLEKLLKIDKKIAIVMALDMLMAGVDTTTSSFSGILLCLAKNPERQAKLREEIMGILPHKDSEFTEEACKNMPYLRACIKESLRCYPLVIGNARAPIKDVVLSGYRVPKDTRVTLVSVSLFRNEKHFVRPNEYLPERWLRASKETNISLSPSEGPLKPACPFIYLPFGFGPRTCIGRRIVEMDLELAIARLIRNFYIEFNYPTHNAFRSVLMNMPNVPLTFKFSDVEH